MKKYITLTGLLSLALVTGCASDDAEGESDDGASAEDCQVQEHAMGIRWFQQGAEARALQEQTFRFASERLDQIVDDEGGSEGLAIITDLDETAIDNSALLARDMAECHDFTAWDTWGHWEQEGTPRLLPGALDFYNHADELGLTIFYLSDRFEENFDDTFATLEELEFPQVEEEQVLLLGDPKQDRRDGVEADYDVVMQLGDTLHDFDGEFADADLEEQQQMVEEHSDRFGDDWIVLPNPTYGEWEDADLDEWDAEFEVDDEQ